MKKKNEEGEKDEGDLQVHMKEKCEKQSLFVQFLFHLINLVHSFLSLVLVLHTCCVCVLGTLLYFLICSSVANFSH